MDIVAAAHPFKSVFQVGCDKQAVAWLAQVLRQRPASVVVVLNNKDPVAALAEWQPQTAQGEVLKLFLMTKVGF